LMEEHKFQVYEKNVQENIRNVRRMCMWAISI
jgi:hypothetical protein